MSPKEKKSFRQRLMWMPLWAIVGGSAAVFAVGAGITVVLPAYQMAAMHPQGNAHPYTAVENRGRMIYFREGCWYCHTQQVRPVAADRALGPPTPPGAYYYDVPQPMGTERTGADLSHIGSRVPSYKWLHDHMIDPEKEVPGSVMPSYSYLREKDLHALVTYLQSLK